MNAIIPHKDTLFFLTDIQRKIISSNGAEVLLFPIYPLFAFKEGTDEFQSGIPTDMKIECPRVKDRTLVFPVRIEGREGSMELEIQFARAADKESEINLKIPEEIKNAFPRRERTFRTATVIFENNGWQVYDDKWFKIS